jgi:hypothetical protein
MKLSNSVKIFSVIDWVFRIAACLVMLSLFKYQETRAHKLQRQYQLVSNQNVLYKDLSFIDKNKDDEIKKIKSLISALDEQRVSEKELIPLDQDEWKFALFFLLFILIAYLCSVYTKTAKAKINTEL